MQKRYCMDNQAMTYHILICDDEPFTCAQIETTLIEYAESNGIRIDTEVFDKGETLYSFISANNDIDLVFLDIELPGISGAKVGNMIRNILRRNDIQIVYISSKTNYALQLFEARPFDFIVKPIQPLRLISMFSKYIQIYGESDHYYEYQFNRIDNKILLSKILYICSNNKLINIVTDNNTYSHYGSIKNLHGKYEPNGFWSVHNSYIINIKYADKIGDDEIVMCNGDIIPVSRKYKPEIRKKLLSLNEVV